MRRRNFQKIRPLRSRGLYGSAKIFEVKCGDLYRHQPVVNVYKFRSHASGDLVSFPSFRVGSLYRRHVPCQ